MGSIHRSVDDCCLALLPRLWQPRNPEGGEATVMEGSLTFTTLIASITAGCSFTSYPGHRNSVLNLLVVYSESILHRVLLFPDSFRLLEENYLQ